MIFTHQSKIRPAPPIFICNLQLKVKLFFLQLQSVRLLLTQKIIENAPASGGFAQDLIVHRIYLFEEYLLQKVVF